MEAFAKARKKEEVSRIRQIVKEAVSQIQGERRNREKAPQKYIPQMIFSGKK